MSTDVVQLKTGSTTNLFQCADNGNHWTLIQTTGVNSQTASYAPTIADSGKMISMNGSSLTLTLPNPPPSPNWSISIENLNASSLTVSRNSLNIDGAASNLTLAQNQGTTITTDGSNYFSQRGIGGGIITSGSSLPALPCTGASLFNLTGSSGQANQLYRCITINGGVTYWQQVKPTVETIYAKDYGVLATAQIVPDATTTLNNSTITCPNNDCNFTSNMVGWIVWAKNAARSATVCPQSTISTVNSAQSITVTAANDCTSNNTANAYLIWGPDDSTTIDAAYQAANAQNGGQFCTVLQLPAGIMLVQQPEMNYPGTTCGTGVSWQVTGVNGAGATATVIVPTPNFNFSGGNGCSGVGIGSCFFGVQYEIVQSLKIWGLDTAASSYSGCSGKTFVNNNGAVYYDVVLTEWGIGCTNSVGFNQAGNQAQGFVGGSVGFGQTTCQAGGTLIQFINWPCYNSNLGLNVASGSAVSIQNFFSGNAFAVQVASGATLSSFQDTDFGTSGGTINVNGRMLVNGYIRATGASSSDVILVNKGAVLNIQNTPLTASNSGTYNGFWAVISPAASVNDLGGNTFAGGILPAAGIPPFAQTPKNCTPASGSTQACAYASNTTTGNAVIVAVVWNPSGNTVSGCSGSVTGSLTQQGSTLTTPSVNHAAENVALFYKPNITGGAETITCTFSGSVSSNMGIMEATGIALVSPVDASATNTGSGNPISTSNLTTTQASDLVMFVGATNFGGTLNGPPSGFTNQGTLTGSSGVFAATSTTTFAAQAYTMSGTLSASTYDWAVFSIGFKNISVNPNFFGQWSIGGTAQTTNNLALTSNWGTGATVTGVIGDAIMEQFTITPAGTPGANPVFTITFPGTGFQRIPTCTLVQTAGTFASAELTTPSHSVTKTTDTITFAGTPVAAHTYTLVEECR